MTATDEAFAAETLGDDMTAVIVCYFVHPGTQGRSDYGMAHVHCRADHPEYSPTVLAGECWKPTECVTVFGWTLADTE